MKIKTFKLFILSTLVCMNATAQENVNLKFGKPTKAELQMTTYAADTTASAVVLCRLTDVEYTIQPNGYLVDYHEKFRIKVLKPEGARYASVTIPYYRLEKGKSGIKASRLSLKSQVLEFGQSKFKNNSATGDFYDSASGSMTDDIADVFTDESVENLKATAFNLVNGKTVKSNLSKGSVVTEQVDNEQWQVRFTIPDVTAGTVIEYEYTLHSQLFYMLHDWYAQCDIPVEYARLDMDIPNYLIFNIEEHGIQRLTCTCTTGVMRYKIDSDPIAAPITVGTNHYICLGRNLKAMPKDRFVWDVNDYCAGITAELKTLSLRGTMPIDYACTWEQIDQLLLDDEDLGKQLDNNSPLHTELDAANVQAIADGRQRMEAVCSLVFQKVKWDGSYHLGTTGTSATLKKGTGSNADINMLLIQSLRHAGLQAFPVVLRTRDKGLLPYNFPSITKLNTFLVAVQQQNGSLDYIDASSPGTCINSIPQQLQVERARLVAPNKKSQWVNLQKVSRCKTNTVIEATLTPDGLLKGTQTVLHSGYGPDSKDVTDISLQGTVTADGISFAPLQPLPIKENPFTADQRLLPVEFPYSETNQVLIMITLPEGYQVAQTPEPIVATTPDKGINGRLTTTAADGKVDIQYQFNINKVSHPNKNYAAIKDMFSLFASQAATQLVAKHP